jgi:hypothetical protein
MGEHKSFYESHQVCQFSGKTLALQGQVLLKLTSSAKG